MNEFVQGILVAFVPALLVSILTSYITVRLSMKQFYSQKWWEKKSEAYSHIIEHLSYLQYCYGEWSDEEEQRTISGTDRKGKNLSEEYGRAKEYVKKATAIGAYIVSDKTAAVLTKLLTKFERTDYQEDYLGYIDRNYGLVKDCITKIREYAKVDLLKK